jgi:hypothetical protein
MSSWISVISLTTAAPAVASVAWSLHKAWRARAEKVAVSIILNDHTKIEIRSGDFNHADHLIAALSALSENDSSSTPDDDASNEAEPGRAEK